MTLLKPLRAPLVRLLSPLLVVFAVLISAPAQAEMKIVRVESPGGIVAWLVEEHSIPIISISADFVGGESLIPTDKAGLAPLFMSMLEEGAGPYSDTEFAQKAEELAVRMSFSAGSDSVSVGVTMLLQNRDASIDLFKLALQEPRFDAGPLERVKAQISSGIRQRETDPDSIASERWFATKFPDDPYGRPSAGSLESVGSITVEDLQSAQPMLLNRERLFIGVVGAISPEELGPLLDEIFLPLPVDGPDLPAAPTTEFKGGVEVVEFDAPQSTVMFGHGGILRDDEDFIPAYVMNYILGGGGFSSRLTEEVREKRGFAYSVYSYLYPLDRAGLYMGGVGTANESVAQAMEIIRAEWSRMAKGDVSEEELEAAKRYLIGSYPLRFDSNSKIAGFLVGAQREDLGIDYVEKRNGLVAAVTLEDIQRVAKRVLDADGLFFVVVGKPEGL